MKELKEEKRVLRDERIERGKKMVLRIERGKEGAKR